MTSKPSLCKEIGDGQLQCLACGDVVRAKLWTAHVNSRKHIRKLKEGGSTKRTAIDRVEHPQPTPPKRSRAEDDASSSASAVTVKTKPTGKTKEAMEVLPAGFFDDPKKNSMVKEAVEKKEHLDAELERFLKEVDRAVQEQRDVDDDELEQDAVEKELEEIDEQIDEWRRVNELEKRRDALREAAIRTAREAREARATAVEMEEDDDRELCDNWRAKTL